MPSPMTNVVVLLRGINVGGHKKLPMAELRTLASQCGLTAPRTYIQSGNLVAQTTLSPGEVRGVLEEAIEAQFGFHTSVIVRTAPEWRALLTHVPFADAAEARPKFVHAGLPQNTLEPDAADALMAHATNGERVAVHENVLWIDYAAGVGRSKLTPKRLDAAAGSPVTCRNWRTMQKIAALLDTSPPRG